MHVDITGRQVEITPALRRYAQDKLRKLEKLLDGPLEAHVVLAIEKHRHLAEIQVRSRTAMLSGMRETEDLYASINDVVDKLERQAKKHKEKLTERKKRQGRKASAAAAVAEAVTREAGPAPVGPRILRSTRYRLKPLSAEDAVLELEATGEDLLVYRDAETYRVNVVHRRSDGNYALVDPEF